MPDVTRILTAIEEGDTESAEALLPLVYDELRKLAVGREATEAAHKAAIKSRLARKTSTGAFRNAARRHSSWTKRFWTASRQTGVSARTRPLTTARARCKRA